MSIIVYLVARLHHEGHSGVLVINTDAESS